MTQAVIPHDAAEHLRRFGGINRLYGEHALDSLRDRHIVVVGVGGVGSWVVEALARSGIGRMTLIDLDHVALSNTNRQIQATTANLGKAKIAALAERVLEINPSCLIHPVEDYITPENSAALIPADASFVVDAIDQVKAKAALIAYCQGRRLPIITAGAAGGKINPGLIRIDDLSNTIQDPLLAKVRALLRREYGYPRGPGKKFAIPAVFSQEPVKGAGTQHGLSCAGYGSSVCITASFGFFLAAEVINRCVASLPAAACTTPTSH